MAAAAAGAADGQVVLRFPETPVYPVRSVAQRQAGLLRVPHQRGDLRNQHGAQQQGTEDGSVAAGKVRRAARRTAA